MSQTASGNLITIVPTASFLPIAYPYSRPEADLPPEITSSRSESEVRMKLVTAIGEETIKSFLEDQQKKKWKRGKRKKSKFLTKETNKLLFELLQSKTANIRNCRKAGGQLNAVKD